MRHYKLPALRTVVEHISLETVKLDRILADSQSRVASYLDVRYPDGQDIIFLLGGKAVKAGRFLESGRQLLKVQDALEKLRTQKQGTISFFEISKLLMIIILGTFIFQPTHRGLKSKLINFQRLLDLLKRKKFTGYLELSVNDGLNYLSFFNGQDREGYFANPVSAQQMEFPVKLISEMVENSDERGEINVYESVGEEELHDDVSQVKQKAAATEPEPQQSEEEDQYLSEILELCLVAIFEELFRIMAITSRKELSNDETDMIFSECLNQAALKFPRLFKGTNLREDGSMLPAGGLNFERLLKAKATIPAPLGDQEFFHGMLYLSEMRLRALRQRLSRESYQIALDDLAEKIAMSKKTYQGSYTIMKFLLEFSRVLERNSAEAGGEGSG